MKRRLDRGGAGIWIFIILLLFTLLAGFRVGKLYFDNESIKSELELIGDNALTQPKYDAKTNVVNLLQTYEVLMKPDDVTADFNEKHDRVTISFHYSRRANLLLFQIPLSFNLSVQREAQKGVGILQGVQESLDGAAQTTGQRYEGAVKEGMNAGGGLPSTDQ